MQSQDVSSALKPAGSRIGSILPTLIGLNADAFSLLRRVCWPLLDLGFRIWLAQQFFVSGVIKVTHWDTALDLAAHEYPVSWMSPTAAAYTGAAIEIIAPIFLASGLLARYAALALLALSLVIQFSYQPFDGQLFWIALFGWYAVAGAGPMSLDQLLRRGLADSALPLVPRIIRISEAIRAWVSPAYLSAIRIWLGLTLLAAAFGRTKLGLWLPVETLSAWAPWVAAVGGALMIVGLATRWVAVILVFGSVVAPMMNTGLTTDSFGTMVFAMIAILGAGPAALDQLIARSLARRFPQLEGKPSFAVDSAPKVVIIGGGFGGLSCASALRKAPVSITLIDRGNFHLFQPLLYQVATAALSPGDIAAPIRPLFRDAFNARVLLGTVTGVDLEKRCVQISDQRVDYDYLVIATGATHSYFGKDQWQPYAPGLKRVEDATEIRRRLLMAFERAEATEDENERAALLTFLIVGGGPTGVELAGAIAELARFGMEKEFRRFDPASARVVLVQSGPRILPSFPESLSTVAHRSLTRLGIEVLLDSRVDGIDANGVSVSGKRIAARTVLWAAGVMASKAAQWLGVPADNAGRVKVDQYLNAEGQSSVWVIGDTAASNGWAGKPVPGLAPAAKQGGQYVAGMIRAQVEGRTRPAPFAYRHLGSLATIGRKSAVADFGWIKIWGAPAWWLWGFIHVGFLVGMRNRVSTMVNWFWAYLTFGGGIRLITGAESIPAVAHDRPDPQS
ncbi:MAG TPA: FAD-dependent oxidoreductase [Steroidobacteraceae bacterium]|nr:FAD-dependent oxidoreductase [Steroidobacteraceae bacterium]